MLFSSVFTQIKNPCAKSARGVHIQMHTGAGKDSKNQPTPLPDRVSPSIKEVVLLWRSGCGYLIADKSFVCHSTPHFDSTSREVSYSVLQYHTSETGKCKLLFPIFITFLECDPEMQFHFVYNDVKTCKIPRNTLAFCAILLYNQFNPKTERRGIFWAN